MFPLKTPVSAPELARRILLHPRGGVESLLNLMGKSETEWLELKAASYPKGGRFERGTNADDYRWNVAKAVVALANSIGGVVLLGVTDHGSVIGIEASDPKGRRRTKGAEAFRREVVMQQILLPPKGWRTSQEGIFRLQKPALLERLIALEEIPQGAQSVLAIFVDPVPQDYGFVEIERSQDGSATNRVIYLRKRGAVGQVVPLPAVDQTDALSAHQVRRQQLAAEIPLVWKRFENSGRLARPAEDLLPEVRRYIAALKMRLAPIEKRFTPLMAVQRRSGEAKVRNKEKKPKDDDDWAGSETLSIEESGEVLRTEPEPRRGPVTDLLGQSHRVLLIGEGGSGKSKCLEAFALQEARAWQPGQPWPLMASLSAYSAEGLAGLLAMESGIDWQDLVPRIAAGELTLCLDGLNECPDTFYEQCLADIDGISREYPAASVMLTSRSAWLPEGLQFETFELESMDRELQSKFLENYLEQAQQAESILGQLHLHTGGIAIASSPMLLRIATEVAREMEEIPTQRSTLYRRFLESWFRREVEKTQRSGQALPWQLEPTIDLLAELAFRTRQKGHSRIPLVEASDLMSHRLGDDARHFIDWAAQGTVLVRTVDSRGLVFEHETIQEYLCAEYLAARHEDMHDDVLALRADAKPGIWAMPLAFTFEMLTQPSPTLVDAAWKVEPLIVAARVGGATHFHSEEVDGDLWIQAVLNVLLGQDFTAQTRAISIIARLPPKYPISPYLLASLRSHGFWYSMTAHPAGTKKLERLHTLVCGTDFPWIELLADALVGCKTWSQGLSPALRAIAGVDPTPTLIEVLSSASASELCTLRRRKMISAETFASSWQAALDRSRPERLDLDLLDILRTEKKLVKDILRNMLPRYKTELRRIAIEPELSLRVLSILLRGGVMQARELRRRPGFVSSVCARMSMMNAIRLTQQGLLCRDDIDTETRERLVYDRDTTDGKLRKAIHFGLLAPQDLPTPLQERLKSTPPSPHSASTSRSKTRHQYTAETLENAHSRMKVDAELTKKRWKVVLTRVLNDQGFGFARHKDFDKDIFCLLSKVATNDRNDLREGQELDVRITTSFDQRRKRWGFAVVSGHCIG